MKNVTPRKQLADGKTIDVRPVGKLASFWTSARSANYGKYGKIFLAILALILGLAVLLGALGGFVIGLDYSIPQVAPHLTRDVAFVVVALGLLAATVFVLRFYWDDILDGLETRSGKLLMVTVGLALLGVLVGSLAYFGFIDPMNLLYYGVPVAVSAFIGALVLTNWRDVSGFFVSAFKSKTTKVLAKIAVVAGVVAGLGFAVYWAAVRNQYLPLANAVALVVVVALVGWVVYLFHADMWKGMKTKNFGIIALLAGSGLALYFFVWPAFPRAAVASYAALILFLLWLRHRKWINDKCRTTWDNYKERRRVKREEYEAEARERGEEPKGLVAWFKRHLISVFGKAGAISFVVIGLAGLAFSILINSFVLGFPSLYFLFLGTRNLVLIQSGKFVDLKVSHSLRLWAMPGASAVALLVWGFLILFQLQNLSE